MNCGLSHSVYTLPKMMWMVILEILIVSVTGDDEYWSKWWTYESISGPQYWGMHYKDWEICSKGKVQSPINIFPDSLIYDPNLRPLQITNEKVNGKIRNTGKDIEFVPNKSMNVSIVISGGPLSYNYKWYELKIHLGIEDNIGSEHRIANRSFPVEIQVYGYNMDIYTDENKAKKLPYGIAAISIFTIISEQGSKYFNTFVKDAELIKSEGASHDVYDFSLLRFLPNMENFMTYDGSRTQPGCEESVTWIILNRPMHISRDQLTILRSLTNGHDGNGNLMENNFRPIMPINDRPVRTNIKVSKNPDCEITTISSYNVNSKLIS